MPTFCRHNRFVERCPVCRHELEPPASDAGAGRTAATRPHAGTATRSRPPRGSGGGRSGGVRVRREARADEDGYFCALVPGLPASADARRLAEEIAFAAGRLAELSASPPGLYRELDRAAEPEQASWLAFLIAYLGPLAEVEDPFAGIRAAVTDWHSGETPDPDRVALGPRTAHERGSGARTLSAYRAWAVRAGGQAAALGGDTGWSPERRFERVFERLSLPGLGRAGRYELLVSLGRRGVYALRPAALYLGHDDAVSMAAKRLFAIGERRHLERRAAELAAACAVPLEALDLALFNWGAPVRAPMAARAADDPAAQARAAAALGL